MTIFWVVTISSFVVTFAYVKLTARITRRRELEHADDAWRASMIRAALHYWDAPSATGERKATVAWTPHDYELFGHADTDRLIQCIDQELGIEEKQDQEELALLERARKQEQGDDLVRNQTQGERAEALSDLMSVWIDDKVELWERV